MDMNANEFRCEACGEVFPKAWTDEEAEAECEENFPGLPEGERAVVCDDCFKKMTRLKPLATTMVFREVEHHVPLGQEFFIGLSEEEVP